MVSATRRTPGTAENPHGFSQFIIGAEEPGVLIEDVPYDTLQDAVNAVQDKETIQLNLSGENEASVTNKTIQFTIACKDEAASVTIKDYKGNEVTPTESEAGLTYSITKVNTPSGSSGGTSQPTATVSNPAGGSVTVSGTIAVITPKDGYVIEKITVNGKDVTIPDDGKLTGLKSSDKVVVTFAEAPEEVPAEPTTPAKTFSDVPSGAYYADAVAWAVEKGITDGTSDTSFSPNSGCTRGQVVTFLWRAAGSPAASGDNGFKDVGADKYYAEAVAWAVEKGITVGTGNETFSPNAVCTRAQIVTFLARYADGKASTTQTSFSDVKADAYYADAIQWASENSITSGTTSTTFAPNQTCTRGQVVTFLYRYMGA